MNVDTVEKWTGDALLVFGYHGWCAGAGLEGIALVAARTEVYTIRHVFRALLEIRG